jgi:hypothetical protein
MKKLSKKNQTILNNIRKALETSHKVLIKFKEDNNYRMVRHMQASITNELNGIQTYLIYSDLKSFNALEDYIDEIKDRREYDLSYAMEIED